MLAAQRWPDCLVVVALGDHRIRGVVAAVLRGCNVRWHVVEMELSRDAELPLAAGRNAGVAAAVAAGCTRLVLLDVDCIPGPHLLERYDDALAGRLDDGLATAQSGPRLWCGPVTYLPAREPGQAGYDLTRLSALGEPHPARPAPPPGQAWPAQDLTLFWSLSFAIRADDWARVGGFCEQYVGYGAEDTDFAATVGSMNGDMVWLGGAQAYHQHHPTTSPPVEHLGSIIRNARIFASRWGWFPMHGWLKAFAERGLAQVDDTGWQLTPLGVHTASGQPGAHR